MCIYSLLIIIVIVQGDTNHPADFCSVEMRERQNFVSTVTPYLDS